LVLSMHPEDQFAMRALKAGAAGYITKERAPQEVVKALKQVLAGERYVNESFAQRLVLDMAAGTSELNHENLSHREFQVLRMIASGKRLTDIANTLGVSVKTVSTYKTRILRKLRLKTKAEIASYVQRNQIV
jgi:two-component system, NarL family, invasion response regulator UvrY